jgi:hydroxymethylpyrimidine/phosphomethylpyrimidine kinase
MVAKSGDPLLRPRRSPPCATCCCRAPSLITPNLPEAARLFDAEAARDEAEMAAQGEALLKLGPRAVLIKGGHASGTEAIDLLVTANRRCPPLCSPHRHPQHPWHGLHPVLGNRRGSGQGAGDSRPPSRRQGLSDGRARSGRLAGRIGKGQGPVHHFHAMWPKQEGDPHMTSLSPGARR